MNEPADATPEALAVTVIVFVELLNAPDAPEMGAVNVTLTPLTGTAAASFTVTESAVPKAVLMAVDCGDVPEPAVMVAGVCTTVRETVPLVADALAPPPEAVAALVAVVVGAFAGTVTLMLITSKDAPLPTACVLEQDTAFVPEQLQPVPLKDAAAKPVGSVSVTVVVPEVAAEPVFDTVTVSVPPVCPCVNVPLYPSLTLKTGSVVTVIWPLVPVIEGVTVSVAVMVWLPAVASVAENVPTPEVRVELDGRVGDPSVLVKWTVPV